MCASTEPAPMLRSRRRRRPGRDGRERRYVPPLGVFSRNSSLTRGLIVLRVSCVSICRAPLPLVTLARSGELRVSIRKRRALSINRETDDIYGNAHQRPIAKSTLKRRNNALASSEIDDRRKLRRNSSVSIDTPLLIDRPDASIAGAHSCSMMTYTLAARR